MNFFENCVLKISIYSRIYGEKKPPPPNKYGLTLPNDRSRRGMGKNTANGRGRRGMTGNDDQFTKMSTVAGNGR